MDDELALKCLKQGVIFGLYYAKAELSEAIEEATTRDAKEALEKVLLEVCRLLALGGACASVGDTLN